MLYCSLPSELVRFVRPRGRVVVGALNLRGLWGITHRVRLLPWDELLALGARHGNSRIKAGLCGFPGVSRADSDRS